MEWWGYKTGVFKIREILEVTMSISAARKMSIVRSNLLIDNAFWAHIGFGLELVEDPTCDAGWTDGIRLGYNPKYVMEHSLEEAAGLFLEECGHIVNGHLWRWEGLDKNDANRAADLALFTMIAEIPGCEIPREYYDPARDAWCQGKSMEWIYSQIHKPKPKNGGDKPGAPQNQGGNGPKQGKQGGNGQDEGKEPKDSQKPRNGLPNGRSEVRRPPKEKIPELKLKWEQAIIQAAEAAKAAGKLPAGLAQIVDKIVHPKIDWRIPLRKFMQSFAKGDKSWARPNKKYIPVGLYLPSPFSEALGKIMLFGDTSGSQDYAEARAEFIAEFGSIHAELRPEITYTAYFDTEVYPGGEFGPDEEIEWKPKGGGGTDFRPLFPYLEERGIEPACVVILTDGWGKFSEKPPDVPVLWAMTTDVEPPFGEVIRLG